MKDKYIKQNKIIPILKNLRVSDAMFRYLMETKIVLFEYDKHTADEHIFRLGTRNVDYIALSGYPVGGEYKGYAIPYFDFYRGEWRSAYGDETNIIDYWDYDTFVTLYGKPDNITQQEIDDLV